VRRGYVHTDDLAVHRIPVRRRNRFGFQLHLRCKRLFGCRSFLRVAHETVKRS
jgi:hypothetical protein